MFYIIKRINFSLAILAMCLILPQLVAGESIEYEGLIESYEVIDIGAPVEGIVANVAVERSNLVKKGQILVELESSVERATLEKTRAMANFEGEIRDDGVKIRVQPSRDLGYTIDIFYVIYFCVAVMIAVKRLPPPDWQPDHSMDH